MANRRATRPYRRLSVADYAIAWRMHAAGANDFAIAERLGCNSRTIYLWRKAHDLAPRFSRPRSAA